MSSKREDKEKWSILNNKKVNCEASLSLRFLEKSKFYEIGAKSEQAMEAIEELWDRATLYRCGKSAAKEDWPIQTFSQNQTSFSLPTLTERWRDQHVKIWEIDFQGAWQLPLKTTRESLSLSWVPQLLLITECHSESVSSGNLHNWFYLILNCFIYLCMIYATPYVYLNLYFLNFGVVLQN